MEEAVTVPSSPHRRAESTFCWPSPHLDAPDEIVDPHRTTILGPHEPATHPPAPASPPPRFLGRYHVLEEVGQGGMGVVYRVYDPQLDRELAIKVLAEHFRGNAELTRRFLAEARVTGRLQHPGIVPVHETGTLADGVPFFAMKLVEGCTLSRLLKERPTPDHDRLRFFKIFEQICLTIAFAHARSVIHRDLKPHNIMVGAFGEVQVMDWGLSKELNSAGPTSRGVATEPHLLGDSSEVTVVGAVMGTPAYMAPEQARGEIVRLDARADVFGLGSILCEILTGKPAFAATDSREAFRQASRADLVDAWKRLDQCTADAELVQLARSCLAAEPGDRPANADALTAVLSAYHSRLEERSRAVEVEQARASERHRRRRLVSVMIGVACVALLIAIVTLSKQHQERVVADERAEQVRRTHNADAERYGEAAYRDAVLARERARTDRIGGPEKAAAALEGLRRAEERLNEAEVSADLRERIADLKQKMEQEARTRRTLARLDEILLLKAEVRDGAFDMMRAVPEYEALFNELDIRPLQRPIDDAARMVRESPIREDLITALDDWAFLRSVDRPPDEAASKRLFGVARLADDNALRNSLRDTLTSNSPARLKELAAARETATLSPGSVHMLADALARRGLKLEAELLLRRALQQHADDFWLNHSLGLLLVNARRPLDGVPYLTAATALRPQSPGAFVNLGVALADLNRFEQALAAYDRAVALKPDYAQGHYNRAVVLQQLSRSTEALAAIDRALAVQWNDPQSHLQRCAVLTALNRRDEALEAATEALHQRPDFSAALYRRATLLEEKGRTAEAKADLDHAAAMNVIDVTAVTDRVEALLRLGRTEEALALSDRLVAQRRDSADAYLTRGLVLQHLKRNAEALAAVDKAITLRPEYAGAHYNRGFLLERLQRPAEALPSYERALALRPDYFDALVNRGGVLRGMGRLQEALDSLTRAVAVRPNDARAHLGRGNVLVSLRQYDAAADDFVEAIRIRPNYAEAHCNLGNARKLKGRFVEALECYKRGHDIATHIPDWPYPSAQWVAQVEHLIELEASLPDVRAGKVAPRSIEDYRSLAWMCSDFHNWPATAARLLEDAMRQAPALQKASDVRISAAEAAARAGTGRGDDAADVTEEKRGHWRRSSLDWLRNELEEATRRLKSDDPALRNGARQELSRWRTDAAFAGLRGAALAALPDDERAAWQRFWADVDALLRLES
jgi:serine/threonine-protein kinase